MSAILTCGKDEDEDLQETVDQVGGLKIVSLTLSCPLVLQRVVLGSLDVKEKKSVPF